MANFLLAFAELFLSLISLTEFYQISKSAHTQCVLTFSTIQSQIKAGYATMETYLIPAACTQQWLSFYQASSLPIVPHRGKPESSLCHLIFSSGQPAPLLLANALLCAHAHTHSHFLNPDFCVNVAMLQSASEVTSVHLHQ